MKNPRLSSSINLKSDRLLVRGFRGLPLIGADVVEVSPPFDPSGNTALLGATIMYELFCLIAEQVSLESLSRQPNAS